jgi:hypothetical protein
MFRTRNPKADLCQAKVVADLILESLMVLSHLLKVIIVDQHIFMIILEAVLMISEKNNFPKRQLKTSLQQKANQKKNSQ